MRLFHLQAENITAEVELRLSRWEILFCAASALVSRLIHNGSEVILTQSANWHQHFLQLDVKSESSVVTSAVVVCFGNLTVRIRPKYLQLNLRVPRLSQAVKKSGFDVSVSCLCSVSCWNC